MAIQPGIVIGIVNDSVGVMEISLALLAQTGQFLDSIRRKK